MISLLLNQNAKRDDRNIGIEDDLYAIIWESNFADKLFIVPPIIENNGDDLTGRKTVVPEEAH